MDPNLYALLEPVVVLGTLLGTAFGVKLLVWGKGPIRRRAVGSQGLEQRVVELEERYEHSMHVMDQQAGRIEDLEERLDFTERLLTRERGTPRALEDPETGAPE